ncbi:MULTISPECIES: monovalent cation/H(+) antiporter subunit G [Gordonia]|uniref:Na(+)/H(+) antiporter subunit G n=2 Tax=Gordonia TaxID=2053 RepID=L7LQX8_9ACTN|nr:MULTISPECIES: monovalent cation/H(+) antiporter subunit G [Gordonia]AUH67832.1 Na+/H+ antiporter subunit G [Gordonia sp. YC-JH1]KXT58277.1 cation:proton antiporter [Gordonia sp. QH-12]MBY4570855.1 Na+/H+ antiporter subunit G [Gordonia sihwensis]WFN92472.1 monovalent cation/H(+) antiporter subunit G [Gordonia sihwensis]GAC62587.1 Na(+)/H(+) antiporter subunit G [Gordonia sihwensis NBRC 108236]
MILDVVAAALILLGSLLALTAAIGIVRFPDTLSRMHAATKPQTFGMILVLAGTFIRLDSHPDGGMLVLTGLFALITAPVVAQRVGRLVYREQALGEDVLDEDELSSRNGG